MGRVDEFQPDKEIVLDTERIAGMPDQIKGGLLMAMTSACRKHGCHWTELVWDVKIENNEPVIRVKHVPN